MQFQSTFYTLNESVGAVSMVNLEQLTRNEDLDYLEHLCSFVDRMNINPIWFDNEEAANRLKVLEIYQLAITYSKNLSLSHKASIKEMELKIDDLRSEQRNQRAALRNQKEEAQLLKEKCKLKKHQNYKNMYDTMRNRMKDEEEMDYQRDHGRENLEQPKVVYYYPNPNEQYYQQYPPHPHPQYPPQYAQYPPYPPNPQPHAPWNANPNPNANPAAFNPYPNPPNQPNPTQYLQDPPNNDFLNTRQSQSQKLKRNFTQSKVLKGDQLNDELQHSPVTEMEKSHIIASGERLMENIQKQVKLASGKSISKSRGDSKQRESIHQDSRVDDDQFGDLTVNSKKKIESIKLMGESSNELDQEQYDSIAQIKIRQNSTNKQIGAPSNRFQSKIYGKEEKPSTKHETDSFLSSQSDDLNRLGLNSNTMHSNFSKGKQEDIKGQLLHKEPPKRNSQNIIESNLKDSNTPNGQVSDLLNSNQSAKKAESKIPSNYDAEKLMPVKPKRNNPSSLKPEETPTASTRILDTKTIDIFQSNVGQVKEPPKEFDIYTSNVGSENSKDPARQKMFSGKPKRASQIEPPVDPNANQLKVSIAQSEEMKNSSNMLYSQAVSVQFTKKESNTPPKLEKQIHEEEEKNEYDDDFQMDNYEISQLEQSRLPISNNKQKLPGKSEVNINISSIPSVKDVPKETFARLPNEVFQLKNQNQLNINKNALNPAASSNLAQSDNFFDQIMEIPMNSIIAKRPSVIHKFSPSKINNPKISESLKEAPLQRIPSQTANSPSIRVIDPAGHVQRVQQRGIKKKQAKKVPSVNESNVSGRLEQFLDQSKLIQGKNTSLMMPPSVISEVQQQQQKSDVQKDDEEIDFNLMEKSNIGSNSYNKEGQKKLLDLINEAENQPPVYRDSKAFDDSFFDKILTDQFKVKANAIKSPAKWEEIETYFKRQCQKKRQKLEGMRVQQKQDSSSTPRKKNNSNYDDLIYSQSNVKIQSKSIKPEVKGLNIESIKDMTESITIKDPPKIEQPANTTPKATTENKYSRSNKPKIQIGNQIRKNINQGKNAYDVDDQLNVAAYKNKNLLQKREDDFDSDS